MTDIQTARAFVNEAIEALSIEMYRTQGNGPDDCKRVAAIEATIAVDLERVDAAIGPAGQSIFAALADNIRQAMAALHGAKAALDG
jgi:hypothetical protein